MDEWKDPIAAAMKKKVSSAWDVQASAPAEELNLPSHSRIAPDEIPGDMTMRLLGSNMVIVASSLTPRAGIRFSLWLALTTAFTTTRMATRSGDSSPLERCE